MGFMVNDYGGPGGRVAHSRIVSYNFTTLWVCGEAMAQLPKVLTPAESARHLFGAELRRWRSLRGLSQAELGRLALSSGDMIGKVEKAERWPTPELAKRCDTLLGADGGLIRLMPIVLHQREHAPTPVRPEANTRLAAEHQETLPAPPEFEPLGRAIEHRHRLLACNLDDAGLELLDLAVEDIVQRYEVAGPRQLIHEAAELRGILCRMIASSQSPRCRRRLFRLAGQAAGLLGYMAVNRGRFAHAEVYCREAFDLAEACGDQGLQGWVLGTRSFAAYYQQKYQLALNLAREGLHYAGTGPQAIRLRVNGEARALARLPGLRREALTAVDLAFMLQSTMTLPAGMSSCIAFSPYSYARIAANAATVHVNLGNTDEALAYIDEIDPLVEESDSAWSRALVGLDRATALLRATDRDVEQAMAFGNASLDAATDNPIRSVWQRACEFAREAHQSGPQAPVRDFNDRLHDWR
jgi:transcriptional regulator with XRE-family HTH domain